MDRFVKDICKSLTGEWNMGLKHKMVFRSISIDNVINTIQLCKEACEVTNTRMSLITSNPTVTTVEFERKDYD